MLDLDRTAILVCHLLSELPGIVVTSTKLVAGRVRFDLAIGDGPIIDTLHRISLGANVALEHPANSSACSLTAMTERIDELEFGNLQLLGVHLVWHLHNAGLLTSSDANDLLHQWHGALVGA